jgi:pSer/pThr/pTyr-binding forkhead associated (FHA) protein
VRTLEQYANEYTKIGGQTFRVEHTKPMLIGLGIVGELQDKGRGRTGTVRMNPAAGNLPAPSLIGRVWAVSKSENGPRSAAIVGGRASNNDIVIPDFTISNQHFNFRYEANRVLLIDCGSTNGTFVDGTRLTKDRRVALASGMKLVFGRYQFEFMTAQGFITSVAQLAGQPLSTASLR